MTFEISIKKSSLKFIKGLDKSQKSIIHDFLLVIKEHAVPSKKYDIVKLKNFTNTFRVRFGNIRIVYTVSWNDNKILVQFLGWRKDAYK